ncbi:MAG TPA: aminotransferase class V-fold PLP-dependent enzyme [Flavobacterium sp.]|jgi:isopenicillin-N epimerase
MKSQFLLDPEIIYLNHGSFGACPKPIFQDYQKWQLELEREPVQFIQKKAPEYLRQSKQALAEYISCSPENFFFTPNPTVAINTIMRSLKLSPGDEILSTNHEYGAMDRTWNFYCKSNNTKYIRQPISFPIVSKEQMISDFWEGLTDKTRVIFLNQISSATALIFPVKEICDKAKELGLVTIVDGAHVPGHIPLNLQEIKADFYTGTLHKWMLTPKGCSFLYVKKEFQEALDPLVVSWGYESDSPGKSRFLDYHEYQGTNDISSYLTAPAAIKFLDENNFTDKSKDCRKMILSNYQRFCDLVGTAPICPITEEFLGQMCSIPVHTNDPVALKEMLFNNYRIEIPVMQLNNQIFVRISIQVYNSEADIEKLYTALSEILAGGLLIRQG